LSCSIYIKREAIVIAGKTKPTEGTKMEGKYEAVINFLSLAMLFVKNKNHYKTK
jgi:hypothetical protein